MLVVCTVLFALLLMVTAARLLLLKRELRGMTRTIRAIHGRRTNRQLRVSSQSRIIGDLANAVNALYDDMYNERREHAHAVEEMRQFLADISHDLRTPLTSVLGYLQLLERADNTPEQCERYLAVARSKAMSLNDMVESLFLLAKLDAGAFPMAAETIDAAAVLAEELAGFYEALNDGKDPPQICLDSGPLPIRGDRVALSRVFANLLRNIVKHGGEHVLISAGREEARAVFCFCNRAPALKQDDVGKLFRRFYTGDRARSGDSTGLGLAIVKEFVEAMGGVVRAELEGDMLRFTLTWELDTL